MLFFSLCLTVAFLCWSFTALITVCLWRLVRGRIHALPPALAADCLLLLELLPLIASAVTVTLFVVPGFAVWEPAHSSESINLLLAIPSAFSLVLLVRSLGVVGRELTTVPAVPFQVPFVGVLGCWRPKVIVTRATRSLLNAEELRLVLRHEKSHIMRRDNVRLLAARLVALLTFNLKSWQQMEALRSSQTEFVADSAAVTDEGSALCLAQALVKMARGYPATHYRFASSFAAGTGAIQERVLRLLSAPEAQAISHPQRLFALAGVAALAALLLIAFQHSVQYFCYQTLEKLVSL